MIRFEAIIDDDVLQALAASLQKAADITRFTVNKVALARIRAKARELLQQTPGPVKRPIRWASERQRRAYFASDGFGHGIPYRRTEKLLRDWQVNSTPIEQGLSVNVANKNPAAPFVIGQWQQPFHKNTGWYQVDDKVIALSEFATNELIEAWYSIDWFNVQ